MLIANAISIELMTAPIIDNLSFQIARGECLCFVGPSGCGKTTVLRAIADLQTLKNGSISHDFQRLAFLFQEPRLLPWRNALENVAIVAPERQAEIAPLLQRLGFSASDFAKYPHELSGGMRQRIALARALIIEPDLLLMDEPFSALDHQLRRQLQQLIAEKIGAGMAVCLVTHDRDEAVLLGSCILRLDGKPATALQSLHLDMPYAARDEAWIRRQVQSPFFAHIRSGEEIPLLSDAEDKS